ncbi:MAG: response regulator [Cyanobacteria bacterium P01_D01_bin.123]
MPSDAEREVRLHFLDEAADYLNEIETVLLGLAASGLDPQQIDGALRAAHSVKGGAAMMGFQVLSDLAHQFEDSFKILKVRPESVEVDIQLETLLLQGLDCLRQIAETNRHDPDVDPAWLDESVFPTFAQLYDRLGDLRPEDETALLSSDEGADMATIMFATEVDELLLRLEGVLATPDNPCLQSEVELMAQELGGLGEMFQLDAFSQLCAEVERRIKSETDSLEAIARAALDAWRRTQALIAINQRDLLPATLDLTPSLDLPASGELDIPDLAELELEELQEAIAEAELPDGELDIPAVAELPELGDLQEAIASFEPAEVPIDLPVADAATPDLAASAPVELPETELGELQEAIANFEPADIPLELPEVELGELQDAIANFEPSDIELDSLAAAQPVAVPEAAIAPQAQAPTEQPTATRSTREATVRVPVKQLDILNDLFGELIIERNALNLRLSRLKNLVNVLRSRVNNLESSNTQLRTYYDRVATEGTVPTMANVPDVANVPASIAAGLAPQLTNLASYNAGFDILEMDRYSDLHLLSQEQMETIVQIQEVTGDIDLNLNDVNQTTSELNRTAKDLQANVMRARMRPLSDITARFPRAVRDLSVQFGKSVALNISGGATSIDRLMLEALSDPLMHLVRNAFDHGIESPDARQAAGKPAQGTIDIRAFHRGNQTLITVSDDGGGINLDKVRDRARKMGYDDAEIQAASKAELLDLIFEPGFSTADRVTALSGRGVGMDVVRTNLKRIRGTVSVDTRPGRGTTFTIAIPFTLSILRVLIIESNGTILAIPSDSIDEMMRLDPNAVLTSSGQDVFDWDGTMMPLIRLGEWLQFRCPRHPLDTESTPTIDEPTVLIVNRDAKLTGIQIDRFWGEQEVAIRQVEPTMPLPSGFTGCTILGDGQVVPLADVSQLLAWIGGEDRPSPSAGLTAPVDSDAIAVDATRSRQDAILIVDDSINVRRFLALTLDKAGYRVEQAKDGQDAVEKLTGGLNVQAVICDIEMPRLDGFGVLAQLRADSAFKDLPVAMLTSRSGDKHRQLAFNLGATAYFSKPYNEQDLLRTLKDITHQPVR